MIKKIIFILIVLIALGGSYLLFVQHSEQKSQSPISEKLFPTVRQFNLGESQVFSSDDFMNPETGQAFGMLVWLKFKTIPSVEQRTFVLRKYLFATNTGYSLAFNNFNDGFYPQIFWSQGERGRWFTFQKFTPKINRWYGFLLTFTEDQYLGLHLLKTNKSLAIEKNNLGGYSLKGLLPASSADLEVGSIATKLFHGAISKVSFFKLPSEEFSLPELLEEISEVRPDKLSDVLVIKDLPLGRMKKAKGKNKEGALTEDIQH